MIKIALIKISSFFLSTLCIVLFSAHTVAEAQGPQISVSGNGKVSAKADQATVNLNVSAQAANSKNAKDEIDVRINSFFQALKKLGIKEKQITAGSMNLSPQYDYQSRQPRFIGFQANRSIGIEILDLEKLHPVLDTAISMKINGIQGINYASSSEDDMRQQARLAAIEDSKTKAKQLAEAYDAKLGPVYSINYYSGNIEQPYMARQEMRALAVSDSFSQGGQFIPGEVTVSDNINVTFDLITN